MEALPSFSSSPNNPSSLSNDEGVVKKQLKSVHEIGPLISQLPKPLVDPDVSVVGWVKMACKKEKGVSNSRIKSE